MHGVATQLAWQNPFWTISLCHRALDSLLNPDFFTFYRECQRPVALQLQLYGQSDILEFWLLKFWTSLTLISACSENCTYLSYFTDCWITLNVFYCDVITDLVISNFFWRSKILQSVLLSDILKISNISIVGLYDIYQNTMILWKYHDIFDILIFFKISYFYTLLNITSNTSLKWD